MRINRRENLKLIGLMGTFVATNSWLLPYAYAQETADSMNIVPSDKIIGSEDAPLTIVEYASMTCHYCANFHINTLPAIKEKYINTGKVRLVFREFPFPSDFRSIAAFMLARSVGDKYFAMVDVLFRKQTEWATAENPVPILLNIAKIAGLTEEEFNLALKNQKIMDDILASRDEAAKNFGITGTPTFFVNGNKYVGFKSVEEFSNLIENAM